MRKIMVGFLSAILMLSFASAFVSADIEPNDYYDTAEAISDGDVVTGSLGDSTDVYDYYVIPLSFDDTIEIILSGSSGADYDLKFYDDDHYWLDGSTGSDSDEYIYFTTTESNRYYYIEISSFWADVGDIYTLSVDVRPGDGGGGGSTGGDLWVCGDPENEPVAEVPTMTVGDGVYWGGVKDIGAEIEDELDTALAEYEDMGFDVSYDISGGIGAYFGIEVASDSAYIGGVTCYDIEITGAIAIDVGLSASVDGSISESGYEISIDGSGNGFMEIEMNLDGHMYLTVDELALAKIDLTFTAEGRGELYLDVDYTAQGISQSIRADAEMSINDVQIDFELAFDPPLDIYQLPMWEGKEWYVPGYDTEVSGSMNAQGKITYDYTVTAPGEPRKSDSNTTDLATQIGSNDFYEMIPGGSPNDWGWDGGALFSCAYANGDIFIIETEMGDAFGYMDYGTRQAGIPDVNSMMPTTGLQFNSESGLITGMTMDGVLMTEEVTAAEVEEFAEDPLAEVKAETGGHDAGAGGILGIILIGVILIVVVIMVVVVLTKKKTPPVHHHPQPYQQQQQPPPPPAEYQPQHQQQDQYQQPPDNQQPPPPPPPGY